MHITLWPSLEDSDVSKLIARLTWLRSHDVRSPPYWEPKSAYPYSETIALELSPASVQTNPKHQKSDEKCKHNTAHVPPTQPPVAQFAPFPSHPVRPQARMPYNLHKHLYLVHEVLQLTVWWSSTPKLVDAPAPRDAPNATEVSTCPLGAFPTAGHTAEER